MLTGIIETRCACCGEPIEIRLDSQMRHRVLTAGARPVISSPRVDFERLKDPSIVDAF